MSIAPNSPSGLKWLKENAVIHILSIELQGMGKKVKPQIASN